MPSDALISAQNAFGGRTLPVAHSAPPDPYSWIQWILLLKGKGGGNVPNFVARFEETEALV